MLRTKEREHRAPPLMEELFFDADDRESYGHKLFSMSLSNA